METHSVKQVSAFFHLFHSGGLLGFVIILLGLLLVAWGVLNLAIARNRVLFLVHGLLCFVPLLLGLFGMFHGYSHFSEMLMYPTAPKLRELVQTMSFVMTCGIFGGIATMLPSVLSFFAFDFKGQKLSTSRTDGA